MSRMRPKSNVTKIVVALAIFLLVGYALVTVFSDTPSSAQDNVVVAGGAPIDSLGADPSEDALLRAQLPDPASIAPRLSQDDLKDGYIALSFAKLADYEYVFPDPDTPKEYGDQIPESVRKLSERKVAVQGFMMPIKLDGQRIKEFLLLKDRSACCWGVTPELNDWIHVTLPSGDTVPHINDIPFTVFGELLVGEYYDDKDALLGIYRLKFHKLIEPR